MFPKYISIKPDIHVPLRSLHNPQRNQTMKYRFHYIRLKLGKKQDLSDGW